MHLPTIDFQGIFVSFPGSTQRTCCLTNVFSKKITNISGSVSVKVVLKSNWRFLHKQGTDPWYPCVSPPKQHCDTQDVFFPKIMSSIFSISKEPPQQKDPSSLPGLHPPSTKASALATSLAPLDPMVPSNAPQSDPLGDVAWETDGLFCLSCFAVPCKENLGIASNLTKNQFFNIKPAISRVLC